MTKRYIPSGLQAKIRAGRGLHGLSHGRPQALALPYLAQMQQSEQDASCGRRHPARSRAARNNLVARRHVAWVCPDWTG